jgi:hypothetical protein
MDQVNRQRETADQVRGNDPPFLKCDIDTAEEILYRFFVAWIGDHRQLIGKSCLPPKITHMQAEEGKYQDTQECHVF